MTVDLKKELARYRARHGSSEILTVPPMRYVMIDGSGDPNTAPANADALATISLVAYNLEVPQQEGLDRDCTVMPLEGLRTILRQPTERV